MPAASIQTLNDCYRSRTCTTWPSVCYAISRALRWRGTNAINMRILCCSRQSTFILCNAIQLFGLGGGAGARRRTEGNASVRTGVRDNHTHTQTNATGFHLKDNNGLFVCLPRSDVVVHVVHVVAAAAAAVCIGSIPFACSIVCGVRGR